MTELLETYLPPLLSVAAVAYAGLAIRVSRSGPQYSNSMVSFLMFLFAGLVAGEAFSYGATDASIYSIGRVFSFFSAGFIPVVFYIIYREYTVGSPNPLVIVMLSIIPVATTALALTNSMHNILWTVDDSAGALRFTDVTEHYWYTRVYAPFIYGLIGFSALGLAGRLPSIAPAHRRTVTLLLVCGMLPFLASIANTFLGMGPPEFPFAVVVLTLLWPFFAYLSVKVRVHEFSPLAYQTLFNHVRDPIFVIDNEQRIICANHAAQELLGADEKSLVDSKLWEDFPVARAILEQARELDMTQTLRMDTNTTYEVSVGPLTGPRGQNMGMVVVCRDVTERRKVMSQLADSEHLIRTLIETSSNGILRFKRDESDPQHKFRCVFANRSAQAFIGDGQATLIGMPLEKLDQLDPERLLKHFLAEEQPSTQVSFETSVAGDDSDSWLRVVAEPVGEDFSVTLVDITQRKRNEDKMLSDALRDPLTGVLNRRGFEKEGRAGIRNCTRGAVLYLDLNQFKAVNDRFGHQAGDALLKAFGHRLDFCLRPEDTLGRLGGDEFAIVLPDVSVEDVRHIAERLIRTSSEAYIIQGQEIKCTASVGIALLPKHGEELWHLLSVADQAMYDAKAISDDAAANDPAAYIDAATAP
jgi:diguanylate cyclase (GGDEF)-like protein/PAS domain S-box-containing protein